MGVRITEDETDGRKEITLARTIAADDDIVFWREGLDDRLILVATRAFSSANVYLISQGRWLACTYLLKPWMIICLTYILKSHARRDNLTGNNAFRGQIREMEDEGIEPARKTSPYALSAGKNSVNGVHSVATGRETTRGAKSARLDGRGVLPGGEAGVHRKKSDCGGPRSVSYLDSEL